MADPGAAGPSVERDAVVALIRDNPGEMDKRGLARAMRLSADEKVALKLMLRDLLNEGVIERQGRRGYVMADAVPPVSVVEFTAIDADGDLVGRVAGRAAPDGEPPRVRLAPGGGPRRGPALGVGDRALCRLAPTDDGAYEARVIKRFARDERRLLGVVREGPGGLRIAPVVRGERHEWVIRPADAAKLSPGDLATFTPGRDRRQGLRTADIAEVIGSADAPGAATVVAMHLHGVQEGFSAEEDAEAAAAEPVGPDGREDLTDIPLLTIDPEDARDHDDAVWAAPDDDPKNAGGWVVIVAIADVAAYVPTGSALDRGARRRGNSTYFPDRVAPMLPERLSADLCSLREGEPRPCLAVRMTFSPDGAKRGHRFVRGLMRSAARLAYEDAQAAIDGRDAPVSEAIRENVLRPLWGAYRAVAKARAQRAPLEIDAPERRVRIGADGKVADVMRPERLDAHRLIEEFMILANVCAAQTLEAKRSPLVYRVHDAPAAEKIDMLADFLATVGLRWAKGEAATPKRFNRLLAQARQGEHAEVVNEIVLRAQSQAVYAPENIGHFGLNLDRYAHFTSPIRRYADLIVHRALVRALGLGADGLSDAEIAQLDTTATAISQTERRSMAAERDASDRYLAQFLSDRVGSTFEARITGVTRAGLFLRLSETGADGLAPISTLGRERFVLESAAHALVGEETGGRYRLGRTVRARLTECAPIAGGLLFDVLDPPEPGPRPKGGRRGPVRGRRGRGRR